MPCETALYLPVVVCLLWAFIHAMMAFREPHFPIFLAVLLVTAAGIFTFDVSEGLTGADYRQQMTTGLIALATVPCLLPLSWQYLSRLFRGGRVRKAHLLWLLLPAVLSCGAWILVHSVGEEVILKYLGQYRTRGIEGTPMHPGSVNWYYYLLTVVAFRCVILAEILFYEAATLILAVRQRIRLRHLFHFLGGGSIRVAELQVFLFVPAALMAGLRILLPRSVFAAHTWVPAVFALAFSLLLFQAAYIALFGSAHSISLRAMATGLRYNYNPRCRDAVMEEIVTQLADEASETARRHIREHFGLTPPDLAGIPQPAPPAGGEIIPSTHSREDTSLPARFETLMLREQIFREPGLTITSLAERMHTNKTYVSRLVNSTYGMAFPDLLNSLRTEYAKKYILDHPDARQADIAAASGFSSASTFNITFKKATGKTPKAWLDEETAGTQPSC